MRDDNDLLRAGELPDSPFVGTVELGPDGAPWGPPRPLRPEPRNDGFPYDSFPPVVDAFVRGLANELQVPMALPGLLVLPALSVAAPRAKVEVRPGWVEPHLGVFVCVALPSGERKSPTLSRVFSPLAEWERRRALELAPAIARSRAIVDMKSKALNRATRQGDEEQVATLAEERRVAESNLVVAPRLMTGDSTAEALVELMASQRGRIASVSPEATLFDIVLGRHSKRPSLDVYLQGYSGESIRVDRVLREASGVDHPMLSIALATQPSVLRELGQASRLRGRGLLSRFFWSAPPSRVGRREVDPGRVSVAVEAAYGDLLRTLLSARAAQEEQRDEPLELRLSGEAQAVLREFERELEPRLDPIGGDLSPIADWAGKLAGGVARIAGLLHLARGPEALQEPDVRESVMEDAVILGTYLLDEARTTFAVMGEPEPITDALLLLPYLDRVGRMFSRRDLHQAARGRQAFSRGKRLDAALEVLVEHEYVRVSPDERPHGRAGRPPGPRYVVNPRWSDSEGGRTHGF